MADALPPSILDALLALELGPAGQDAGNRFSFAGLSLGSGGEGQRTIGLQDFEAASLRVAWGPLVLEVGSLAMHQLLAQVRTGTGRAHLQSLEAADAELSDVKLQGPVVLSQDAGRGSQAVHAHGGRPSSGTATGAHPAAAWCLGPLAAADGVIRAEIVDAHLLFDADVTVPVRGGMIEFRDATVEHVGPDSRMGVSRLGLYVDAPNGRSYLYQFSSAPVAGVEFERRGALLGPWVTDRGQLRLQPFGEGLLRQGPESHGHGFTEQARLLLGRTAVSGEVQLGDGKFAAPGVQAEFVGRADGRNRVRIHSEAVGRGLTAEVTALSLRQAVLNAGDLQVRCDGITGSVLVRLSIQDGQMRFAIELANVNLSRLQLRRREGA
jgi:hypothetical protein